jgi:hypothetical protein
LSLGRQGQDVERLTEQLKDKDEAIIRLQVEAQSLQVSHFCSLMKIVLNKIFITLCMLLVLATYGNFVSR